LLLIFRASKHAKGQAFILYTMLYSLARFFLEYLRGDYNNLVWGLFKSAQMTSLLVFIIGFVLFIYVGWQEKKASPTLAAMDKNIPQKKVKTKSR